MRLARCHKWRSDRKLTFSVAASLAKRMCGIRMKTSLSKNGEELRMSTTRESASVTSVLDILGGTRYVQV